MTTPQPQPGTPAALFLAFLEDASLKGNRIYIAGPMTGLPDFNYPAFNAAAAQLRAQGLHVENPAEHGTVEGAEWGDYLRYDIGRVATCGAIYLLKGWENSKGAQLEVHIARTLDMAVMYAPGAMSVLQAELRQKPAPVVARKESPTAGMNIAERILHVGGRNNAAGYVEFGSIQAVQALVRQVLRDLPDALQQAAPVGWKLMPPEPTEAMFTRFSQQIEEGVVYVGGFLQAYRAMIAAAPEALQQAAPDQEVMRERDEAEDFIDSLLDEVLGHERPEWSSAYGRGDALNDVRERIAARHKPVVDKAWERFESAMAAPRQDAPQNCTCPSGDGSLRWPCPAHPAPQQAALLMQREIALMEKAAKHAGITSLLNHGAASCVYSEGCAGVSQEHLLAYTREIALHCVVTLAAPQPKTAPDARTEAAMVDAAMVEMANIYPPLKRSECARLIHAAFAAQGTRP